MTTYTITTISVEQRERLFELDPTDLIDERTCGKTFTGFKLIETGSWAGSYQGVADGEESIFYASELAVIEEESSDNC